MESKVKITSPALPESNPDSRSHSISRLSPCQLSADLFPAIGLPGKLLYSRADIFPIPDFLKHLPPFLTRPGPAWRNLVIISHILHKSAVFGHQLVIFVNVIDIPHRSERRSQYCPPVNIVILCHITDKCLCRFHPFFIAIIKNTESPDSALKGRFPVTGWKCHRKDFKIQLRVIHRLGNLSRSIPAKRHSPLQNAAISSREAISGSKTMPSSSCSSFNAFRFSLLSAV